MTTAKIQAAKREAMMKYDVAAKIREILDEARKAYGAKEWDEDDLESQILELVTEE